MLVISEQPLKWLERHAAREGARSLAFVAFASANSRTFQQRSTHFAAAQSNSFRMTSLYKPQNNFRRDRRPGRIVSRGTPLESKDSAENRFQKPAKNKSLRITSLYKRKNNCPGITFLQKKVGGRGLWAHFSGHSLNQEDLSRSGSNASNSLLCPTPAVSLGSGKHSLPRWEDMIMCSPI